MRRARAVLRRVVLVSMAVCAVASLLVFVAAHAAHGSGGVEVARNRNVDAEAVALLEDGNNPAAMYKTLEGKQKEEEYIKFLKKKAALEKKLHDDAV